jgi:hypothetical protein
MPKIALDHRDLCNSPRSLGKLKLREIVLQADLPQPHPRI